MRQLENNMALRNKDEHSYRTLAMQVLSNKIKEGADAALAAAIPEGNTTPTSTYALLIASLELADLKLALNWLQSLDEKDCPEVADQVQSCTEALKGAEGDANKALDALMSFLDTISPLTNPKEQQNG
jgi:hypothetical protein